jgi:polar amino acid transport system substrate-binding protein
LRLALRLPLILGLGVCAAAGWAQPAPQPGFDAARAIAPAGRLRMGLYPGTPTSLLADAGGAHPRGVGFDLGLELAKRLGVPFQPVVLANNAEVLAAVQAGRVDLAFTNASPARAGNLAFGPPCLFIELGYLVRRSSPVTALAEVDRQGVRIGVTAGSTTEGVLARSLKQARVVAAATVQVGAALLRAGDIDAYATNKPTLFEMAESVPGARVLPGRWGVEHLALVLPLDRAGAVPYLGRFTEAIRKEGLIEKAVERAGLRGTLPADEQDGGAGSKGERPRSGPPPGAHSKGGCP